MVNGLCLPNVDGVCFALHLATSCSNARCASLHAEVAYCIPTQAQIVDCYRAKMVCHLATSAGTHLLVFAREHGSLRAICTVLLAPGDPLLHSERTQGFTADPDYWKGEVFAYGGNIHNLKDLKWTRTILGS